MKTDKTGIWIRCWEGSEMEYEHFSNKYLIELIKTGIELNYSHVEYYVSKVIRTIPTLEFSRYLDDLRGGILG